MTRPHFARKFALFGLSVLLAVRMPGNVKAASTALELPDSPLTEERISKDSSLDEANEANITNEMINLVNDLRQDAGLNQLTANETLCQAASVRARELEFLFSHTRPDGSSFSTIFQDYDIGFGEAGENLAYGQLTALEVTEDWLESPGHRENLLYPEFTDIGAAHFTSNGIHYWVQLFLYQ